MTLHTHVAPRPDPLVTVLCDQLASPLDDVFAREVVAVPTRGIERWLTQRIASDLAERGIGDGICANVEFPSPRQLIGDALVAVPELTGAVTAWERPSLDAHVLAAIDEYIDQPWMQLLARYIGAGDSGAVASANRLAAAQKIARLFSSYARRRPEMMRAWASGDDTGPDGAALESGSLWQPQLWRAVRNRLAIPSLPELLPAALEPIRRGDVELDLPPRLGVYGLTATDPLDLDVLAALAEQRHVHIYVLHPSPALWSTVATQAAPAGPTGRHDDPTEDLAQHPLLKVWGRDSRELQLVLGQRGLGASAAETEIGDSASLLSQIQRDIAGNRVATSHPELEGTVIAGHDRSLQIHVCHGDRRQAEVLRDAILHLLAADPALEPRDVVIMTPDLATFAPLLEAAFPSTEPTTTDSLPDLRLRIADRAPAATNPLVRFTATLLSVIDGRLEAGVVRDFVTRPVVQQRFGFDNEAAGELIGLIDDATIAWGLDGAERDAWGAGTNDERTWRRGLDRMLAGVFYGDDQLRIIDRTAPMDGIEGQDADRAGLAAAIVDRIVAARAALSQPRPRSDWGGAISASIRLLATPAWGDEWQLDQLERLLAESFPIPDHDGADPVLTLAEARHAIAGWTDDRPSPLHFRTGNVTVCTLAPMRSVPYKVVCLLGMDEARFPRSSRSDGDDLLLHHEVVGDHSRSAEDRQLLLDALMAAGQHLLVTYSGRDELTNATLPPAVPVAELQDTLAEMVGDAGLAALTTTHPLQSFSSDNFTDNALGVTGPWSFDAMHLDAAEALREGVADEINAEVEWPPGDLLDRLRLDDLITFLQNPAKRYVKACLGFTIPDPDEQADDTLPADLDALGGWSVKDRLLSGLIDGHDLDQLIARERAADALPPGDLGADDLDNAVGAVRVLWDEALAIGYRPASHRPVSATLDVHAHALEGTVNADPDRAHLVQVTPSRLKGKHRLAAYVRLLFLSAADPQTAWTAELIGRRPTGTKHLAITIGPLGSDPDERLALAEQGLLELVALHLQGMTAPLCLPCESAFEWQRGLLTSRDAAFKKAIAAYENDRFSPEARDSNHILLHPQLATLRALLDGDFESLAAGLWAPILPLCSERTL